jgi:hypothetical protein
MRARATLRPGQRGTKKWAKQYGDRLVCVRYRYDEQRRLRYTTVEIIVGEAAWAPPEPAPDAIVGLRLAREEVTFQRAIRTAGGQWDRAQRVWRIRYDQVVALGLLDRLVLPEVEASA